MRIDGFTVKYLLLLVTQILLCNFFNFSQFLMISFLPVMILMLPIGRSTPFCLILAFVTGFAVDFFADGHLGLHVAALLPVALLRRPVIMMVFGSELFSRGENVSPHRQGWQKLFLGTAISTAIFMAAYILIDSAGTRALWVDIVKFFNSTTISTLISLLAANLLSSETEGRWK